MMGSMRINVLLVALSIAFMNTVIRSIWTPIDYMHQHHDPPQYAHQYTPSKAKFARLKSSPNNIYVLGERNSGTNYAASVLRKAFNPPNEVASSRTHEYFSSDIPVLRHKHMLRHTLLSEAELSEISKRKDILWILAVRSPW